MISSFRDKISKPFSSKITHYYIFFCLIFVLMHLLLVSIFSFFHFLLDHEMGTIESWISRNTWELIFIAKLSAFFVSYKLTKLNDYREQKLRDYFKSLSMKPTRKAMILSCFIIGIFYALIVQFGGGIKSNQFLDELLVSSFLGAFFFFAIDIIYLIYLNEFYKSDKLNSVNMLIVLLVIFILASKIVLPYMSKYLIFLVVHFVTLIYMYSKKNLADIFVYLVLIVAPMSSFFGLDLVWDNSFAIVNYKEKVPVFGIIGIWLIAITYYRHSQLD